MVLPKLAEDQIDDRVQALTVSQMNAFASGLAVGLWVAAISAVCFLAVHLAAVNKLEPVILRMTPEKPLWKDSVTL